MKLVVVSLLLCAHGVIFCSASDDKKPSEQFRVASTDGEYVKVRT